MLLKNPSELHHGKGEKVQLFLKQNANEEVEKHEVRGLPRLNLEGHVKRVEK